MPESELSPHAEILQVVAGRLVSFHVHETTIVSSTNAFEISEIEENEIRGRLTKHSECNNATARSKIAGWSFQ